MRFCVGCRFGHNVTCGRSRLFRFPPASTEPSASYRLSCPSGEALTPCVFVAFRSGALWGLPRSMRRSRTDRTPTRLMPAAGKSQLAGAAPRWRHALLILHFSQGRPRACVSSGGVTSAASLGRATCGSPSGLREVWRLSLSPSRAALAGTSGPPSLTSRPVNLRAPHSRQRHLVMRGQQARLCAAKLDG